MSFSFLRTECCVEAEWPQGRVAAENGGCGYAYASCYFITPMAAVAGAVAEEIWTR